MDNLQTRKKSVLLWERRQIGVTLNAALFDSARLED
jgi:hypothetical protein